MRSLGQGSKLTLANSQNPSDFDKLRKISTSKRLRVRINHVSQTFGNEFAGGLTNLLVEKILLAKLCQWSRSEQLTSNPNSFYQNYKNKKRSNGNFFGIEVSRSYQTIKGSFQCTWFLLERCLSHSFRKHGQQISKLLFCFTHAYSTFRLLDL